MQHFFSQEAKAFSCFLQLRKLYKVHFTLLTSSRKKLQPKRGTSSTKILILHFPFLLPLLQKMESFFKHEIAFSPPMHKK